MHGRLKMVQSSTAARPKNEANGLPEAYCALQKAMPQAVEVTALEGGFHVIFTRSVYDLSKAHWARVKRAGCLRIVRERQKEFATFAEVAVSEEAAMTRLPEDGVPAAVQACAVHVDGADKAPVHLTGPASRAPAVARDDEAGDTSEERNA